MLVDTHAHLDVKAFNKDRDEVVARAVEAGVSTIICAGTGLKSSKKCIQLAEEYTEILAAVGFHPHEASTVKQTDVTELGKIANHPRVVALGEMGLDFYRNYSPREQQLEVLKWQLELAVEMNLPVIIHCREAEKEMLTLLRDWTSRYEEPQERGRGVIHCFMGDDDTARQYLEMGFYLSLGGYIGYPASRYAHDVIRSIPSDRVMVETDCPFLSPQARRRKRNEPAFLPLTVEALAEIRGVTRESVARETTQNAERLFSIGGR